MQRVVERIGEVAAAGLVVERGRRVVDFQGAGQEDAVLQAVEVVGLADVLDGTETGLLAEILALAQVPLRVRYAGAVAARGDGEADPGAADEGHAVYAGDEAQAEEDVEAGFEDAVVEETGGLARGMD